MVSAYTFACQSQGPLANAVPMDCEADGHISPQRVDALPDDAFDGVIVTNLLGGTAQIRAWEEMARRRNKILLFDSALGFGTTYEGVPLGRFGAGECFSFHHTKPLGFGEGGGITVPRKHEMTLRSLINCGRGEGIDTGALSMNGKLSDPAAAFLLDRLRSFEALRVAHRAQWERIARIASRIGLEVLSPSEETGFATCAWLAAPGPIEDVTLNDLPVVLGRHYPPLVENALVARQLYRRSVVVPTHPGLSRLSDEALEAMLQCLRNAGSLPAPPVRSAPPRLELRLAISPVPAQFRMVQVVAESLRTHGGRVGEKARLVVCVGGDIEPYDLSQGCAWSAKYDLTWRWVDRERFRRMGLHANVHERFRIESDAEVVAMVDPDILIAGSLDELVEEIHRDGHLAGFIAHITPFRSPEGAKQPGNLWWMRLFDAAGLPRPRLRCAHAADMLRCPAYFNYGFVLAPREVIERIGSSQEQDQAAVAGLLGDEFVFQYQLALSLALVRHSITWRSLPLTFNFPLNQPAPLMRARNPSPEGEDAPENVRVFHFCGNGTISRATFETPETLGDLLAKRLDEPHAERARQLLRAILHPVVSAPLG